MNIQVQTTDQVASTSGLACVAAAAEVEPLLERVRRSERCEVTTLWVLDEPRGGEDLEHPAPVGLEELYERAAGADVLLMSRRSDLMTREVALVLAELSMNGVPVRWLDPFLDGAKPVGESRRSDPEAIAALIGVIDAHSGGRRLKRLIDVALSSLALIFTLPLMLVIAGLIRLDSPGHPLLRQERLGQHRRPFRCLKFRTMCDNAEQATGPVWTRQDDPRVTRVGRFLRKSRLDELPQLVNVLKGDMSIVGARPIRAFFADQLAAMLPIYDVRFIEKPGLTGWAHVKIEYPQTIEDQIAKFHYEFEYIKRRTVWFDFYIMALTVWVVVRMRGL